MSDEEENSAEQQEEEEEDEEGDDDEEEEGDDEDQQEESGDDDQEDQDEEGDEDGSNEDEQGQEQGSQQESNQQSQQPEQALPKFRSIEPEEFKFTSLLAEISSLSNSVDHFITTLPSQGGSASYYRSSYVPPRPPEPPVVVVPKEQPKVVVMKDEDTQVSMQPQIVIQPTKIEKPPVEPAYKISNESTKFLAQLYEENKKLKRWQNSSHSLNNHSSAFYGSRERFQRQEYQKGLFNVDQRNKEIDEAIEMLKRQRE